MQEQRLCHVVYHSRSKNKTVAQLVAPLRILAYHEAFYLRCRIYDPHELRGGEYCTFAIHRIKSLKMEKQYFKDRPENDSDPSFGFPFHEPIQVKAAFWGGAASYVAERVWSADQRLTKRGDGATVLTFTSTSRLEVISWLLSFGPDAELLEPKELREEIKERARGMMYRYEQSAKAGPKTGNTDTKRKQ